MAEKTPEAGDLRETIAALQEEMMQAADALEFERAADLRDPINALKKEKGTPGPRTEACRGASHRRA